MTHIICVSFPILREITDSKVFLAAFIQSFKNIYFVADSEHVRRVS